MWFGQGAHWPPINFVLLPFMATLIAGGSADLLIGRVSAAGNLFALLAPILAGWLSDRTSTRWGRRRPWILAGTAVNLVGLGLLAFSGAQLAFEFAYMLVQLTFNLAGGAYAAVIPDVVPPADRGRASGSLGMMNGLGAVAGLAAVTAATALFGETRTGIVVGFAAIALILAVTTVITLLAVDEPAIIGGHLSDRFGKRKLFVYASGALQAAVASVLLFGLVRSVALVFVLGVLFGIGYGLYVAVDWAIACDVLPDRERSSGRDMGLWHVAFTLPPALAPAAFAPILHAFNHPGGHILGLATGDFLGFRLVFAGAAIWFVLGTLFVSRIRSVR